MCRVISPKKNIEDRRKDESGPAFAFVLPCHFYAFLESNGIHTRFVVSGYNRPWALEQPVKFPVSRIDEQRSAPQGG